MGCIRMYTVVASARNIADHAVNGAEKAVGSKRNLWFV